MKIILLGEPMGLFMANETGDLSEVRTFTSSIAGAEYNVAVGLARLGHQPAYCTRLGFDPLGEKILRGLRENGISTDLVSQAEGESTGLMLKGFLPDGDPAIAYYRKGSAASRISPHDIDRLDLYGCGRLHVTGIFPAVSDSALASVKRLIARADALELPISFDPNLRPQLWESEKKMVSTLNALAQSAETVLPGINEGKLLTGEASPEGIAEFYHSRGVKNVIVKLGKDGAYFSEKGGKSGISPAFPVREIVDTVGAGDGFAAGVISALAEGETLEEAAFRGNVMGAIQISQKSDNEGLPTREQLGNIILSGTA
ncbi:sugar kinase [uncultured Neglectibacter sp.]|uniref:sugar kinase n=1 Tax=uncultured Neglectibacter sp. TaxID=1924108 RepID=UPI0034DECD2D